MHPKALHPGYVLGSPKLSNLRCPGLTHRKPVTPTGDATWAQYFLKPSNPTSHRQCSHGKVRKQAGLSWHQRQSCEWTQSVPCRLSSSTGRQVHEGPSHLTGIRHPGSRLMASVSMSPHHSAVAQVSVPESWFPSGEGSSCEASEGLAGKSHHLTSVFCWSQQVTSLPRVTGRNVRCHLFRGGLQVATFGYFLI